MNQTPPTGFLLGAAFVVVFIQAAFNGFRWLTGAQLDLLPSLIVYAAVAGSLTQVSLLALVGGLCFDSFSANPLGMSVLPLMAVGVAISMSRELIVRDQAFAQILLGLAASAGAPLLAILLLLSAGNAPLLGWGSLWQWFVMAAGGALFTPLWFTVFAWLQHTFQHGRAAATSFRSDREIRRGRG